MNTLKGKALMMGTLFAAVLMATSCGKDKSSPTPTPTVPDLNKVKTAKFTVTITGAKGKADNDYISVVFSSSAVTGSNSTVWKVNGTEKPNENVFSLNDEDFPDGGTKTYVIETTQPVPGISAGYQLINENGPFKISYKAEINGEVVKDITEEVTEDHSVDADYSY